MSDDYWREFEGGRWNPDKEGDTITGYVTELGYGTAGGTRCPLLTLRVNDRGDTKEVLASQTMLKQALAELRVAVGDKVRITLIELRHTGQPSPMKVFDVQHRAGEAHRAAVAPPPAPAGPEPDAPPAAMGYDDGEEPFTEDAF